MSASTLDLLRTMSELIFSGKALGVYVVPSSEIREHLNGMREYTELLERAIGLKVYKLSWSEYEVPILEKDACLKVWFNDRNWEVESIDMVIMSLNDCSKELLMTLVKRNLWIKEVA